MMLKVHGKDAYCYTGGKTFDPALPTVAFIHGAQNDHSVWVLQTRYFAHHGFGVLALDLPGHGRSGGTPLGSVEEMADWLLACLDAAGARRAILIGHSMGSLVALEAAARRPERVAGVALIGTAWPMKVSPALLEASLEREQAAIDMVNIWSHSSMLTHKPSSPGPGFSVVGGARRLMQHVASRGPAQLFHTDFSACNAYAAGADSASALRCPTLFLSGKRDQMTPPKAAARLIEAIPHAEVNFIDDCGHQLMAERPDAVLDRLYDFSARLAPGMAGG